MPALDSLYRRRAAEWGTYYAALDAIIGATGTLVNFGDQEMAGKVNASTFTGKRWHANGLAPTWTPSEALFAFDTPFRLTDPDNWQGLAPVLTFSGTDEEMDTPDAAYFTRALAACSWGWWVFFSAYSASNNTLWAKYGNNDTLKEWEIVLQANSGEIRVRIWDNTAGARINTVTDAAIGTGAWKHLAVTYDGSANASGIDVYIDGAVVASTDGSSGVFSTMQDTASTPSIGALSYVTAVSGLLTAKLAGGPWGPWFVQAQLTAAQVKNIFDVQRHGLGV